MRGVGLAALILVSRGVAAGHPAFRYERPVLPASSAAPETCVALPLELLPHAAPQLEDLRMMTGDREVAYQLRISSDVAEQVGRPEQILNLGTRNGAISFDVEMTEPRYSRVLLKMARSHFSVLVHVTGIDRPGEAGVAFPEIAYSSDTPEDEPQMKLILLPESDFRYLHFEIQTLALEPVTPQDIAGVDVLVESAEPPRYVQAAIASGPQQKPHETIYEFAVPANVPLDRLELHERRPERGLFAHCRSGAISVIALPNRGNTRRSRGGKACARPFRAKGSPWRVCRIRSGQPQTIDLGLGAMSSASTVRLTIQNGDDAPLALHAITLEMRERQVCFLRKANTLTRCVMVTFAGTAAIRFDADRSRCRGCVCEHARG